MKTLQAKVPEAIHQRASELAEEESISLNQFVVTSISNEVIRQETRDFFRTAAAKFSPKAFAEALASIPDLPAEKKDQKKR